MDAHGVRPVPQGEALAVWALWAASLLAVTVTYARLEPDRLYHVSGEGITGGLSRALVHLNFPISLVAIAAVIVALDVLPRRAMLIGGPTIVVCAVTAWPGVVDQHDLDARWINAVPALGSGVAFGLTLAAAGVAGASFTPRRPLDPVRVAVAAVAVAVSIPWFAAELGFALPDGVFLMQRPGLEADGTTIPAVHLGHHHGLDGTFFLLCGLLLSRPVLHSRLLAGTQRLYLGIALAYGGANLAEDGWHEQLVKRGWVDWKIPSALQPSLSAVWLVIVVVGLALAAALRWEAGRTDPAD